MTDSTRQRRVVIVDDSRTVQAMLENAFSIRKDFRVVGFANDAQSAVEIIRRLMPDIVTIDLCMPYLNGAALLEMIGDLPAVCKIVVSDKAVSNLILMARLCDAGAAVCLAKSDLVHNPVSFFKKINAAAEAMGHHRRSALSSVRLPDLAATYNAHIIHDKPVLAFPVPADENARLRYIAKNDLATIQLGRPYDLITKHVAKVTAFPACLLTVIDREIQWIKSSYGLEADSTPRHQAFCNYTISQGGTFVVSNAAADARFASNALVTGAPNIKSYAGHPVMNGEGVAIASLCVVDTRARVVSSHVIEQLGGMAEIIGEMLDPRSDAAT